MVVIWGSCQIQDQQHVRKNNFARCKLLQLRSVGKHVDLIIVPSQFRQTQTIGKAVEDEECQK
jgi:hypothetical protein